MASSKNNGKTDRLIFQIRSRGASVRGSHLPAVVFTAVGASLVNQGRVHPETRSPDGPRKHPWKTDDEILIQQHLVWEYRILDRRALRGFGVYRRKSGIRILIGQSA